MVESLAVQQQLIGVKSQVCLCSSWRRVSQQISQKISVNLKQKGIEYSIIRPTGIDIVQNVAQILSKCDIVHFHAPPIWFVLIAVFVKKRTWVLHLHGYPNSLLKGFKSWVIEKVLIFRCDAVIAVSDSVNLEYQKRYSGLSQKITTVLNGIDISADQSRAGRNEKSARDPETSTPVFAAMFRLEENKGVREFFQAAVEIKKLLPGAIFKLGGDGSLRRGLEEMIKTHNLEGAVSVCGFVDDVNAFWTNVDFFLFTSPKEALPLSILEAQKSNVVVVGYRNGSGSDEIINDGVNGVLVPWLDCGRLAEKCKELWFHPDTRETIRNNASNTIHSDFDLCSMTGKINEIYIQASNY